MLLAPLVFLFQLAAAQTFCSNDKSFCVYSQDNGSSAQFTMQVASTRIQWVAIGFGASMKKAEVYIAWRNSGTFVLQRRSCTSRSLPPVTTLQPQSLVQDAKLTVDNTSTWLVTFTRPKAAGDSIGVDISSSKQPMIWAYGISLIGSGETANPVAHVDDGTPNADLYSTNSTFNSSLTITPLSNSTSPQTIIIIHGILMFIAWQVLCPIAIFIAKFLKKRLGDWWFRLHWGLMAFGVSLVTLISFFLGYTTSGVDHFNPFKYNNASGAHVIIGLVVCGLCFIQLVSGVVIDRLWEPNRTLIPWHDKFHWWVGRITYLLAFINIPLGFALYQLVFGEQVNIGIWISYFVFFILVVAAFIWKSLH